MYQQFMKTFVLTITASFVMTALTLAAQPLSKSGSQTMQDVGATQGKEDIVTHGPQAAETVQDTSTLPSTRQSSQSIQDVGATQGKEDIVTHGPQPASSQ